MTDPRRFHLFSPPVDFRRLGALVVPRRAAVALALTAAGCAGGAETSRRPDMAPASVVVSSTVPSTGSATSPPLSARALGTKVTSPAGDKITVFAYVSPVQNGRLFEDPREGDVYSAIDVELCAGPSRRVEAMWAAPSLFQLVMLDNARIAATVGIKQPTLQPVQLLVGECVRGWVTYEQPVGRPANVVYTGTPPYRWTV